MNTLELSGWCLDTVNEQSEYNIIKNHANFWRNTIFHIDDSPQAYEFRINFKFGSFM